jgi:hypothetical protein
MATLFHPMVPRALVVLALMGCASCAVLESVADEGSEPLLPESTGVPKLEAPSPAFSVGFLAIFCIFANFFRALHRNRHSILGCLGIISLIFAISGVFCFFLETANTPPPSCESLLPGVPSDHMRQISLKGHSWSRGYYTEFDGIRELDYAGSIWRYDFRVTMQNKNLEWIPLAELSYDPIRFLDYRYQIDFHHDNESSHGDFHYNPQTTAITGVLGSIRYFSSALLDRAGPPLLYRSEAGSAPIVIGALSRRFLSPLTLYDICQIIEDDDAMNLKNELMLGSTAITLQDATDIFLLGRKGKRFPRKAVQKKAPLATETDLEPIEELSGKENGMEFMEIVDEIEAERHSRKLLADFPRSTSGERQHLSKRDEAEKLLRQRFGYDFAFKARIGKHQGGN